MEGQFVSNGKSFAPGKLFDGHYRLIRLLDNNRTTITIWLARDLNTIDRGASANDESLGKMVSIMICCPTTALDIEDEQRWQDEFDAAYDCRHPSLIPPEKYAVLNEIYYLVFPYTESKSLRQFIGKNISVKMTWRLISDTASGLNELHIHKPQIVHADIKPSNILVLDDESFSLTNYGIHFETDIQRISNRNDCMAYMAPERFQSNAAILHESDVWALGATLYEVLTGRKPFGVEGGKNQQDNTPMPSLPDQPIEIRELIYACLQANPKKRPTAQQIKDAAHSKKFLAKPKKKKPIERTKEPLGNDNRKKKSVAIATATLLLIGVLVYVLMPHRHIDNPIDIDKKKVVAINYYERAMDMLLDKKTAETGRELLDSLAKANDWQATFLMSRLYFDTRGNDTVLYDQRWGMMRDNCDIVPDNEMAHKYLFDAFELKENDFMILYQLGCDFKAGSIRGCERNLDYALWCFDHAENTLNSSNENLAQYQQELERGRDRISISDHTPSKPSR